MGTLSARNAKFKETLVGRKNAQEGKKASNGALKGKRRKGTKPELNEGPRISRISRMGGEIDLALGRMRNSQALPSALWRRKNRAQTVRSDHLSLRLKSLYKMSKS